MVTNLEHINDYPRLGPGGNYEVPTAVCVGRSILPYEAVLAGLSRRKCGCRERHHTTSRTSGAASASPVPKYSRNPIWGDDIPLGLEEAAAYTGMPVGTFKQKIYAREIDSVLIGKRRQVQPSAVRAYLERHKRPAL